MIFFFFFFGGKDEVFPTMMIAVEEITGAEETLHRVGVSVGFCVCA